MILPLFASVDTLQAGRQAARDYCNPLYRCTAGKEGGGLGALPLPPPHPYPPPHRGAACASNLPHIQLGNAIDMKRNRGRSEQRLHKHLALKLFWCLFRFVSDIFGVSSWNGDDKASGTCHHEVGLCLDSGRVVKVSFNFLHRVSFVNP